MTSARRRRKNDRRRSPHRYDDAPSRQLKQKVASRGALEPNATETRLVAPAALQQKIDALAAAAPSGRAFVRPSGTTTESKSCPSRGRRQQFNVLQKSSQTAFVS